MQTLPNNVTHYKSTKVFNQETVPKGLLKDHSTASHVWGELNIISGTLEYAIGENEVHILNTEIKGVIAPEEIHHIKPIGNVEFFIKFYKG